MSHFSVHIRDTKAKLNSEFFELHRWLDEMSQYFPVQFWLDYHRSFRHNSYGLAYCKSNWGPKGEMACRIHLLRDWKENIRIDLLTIEEILTLSNQSLLYWNNLDNFDIAIYPSMFNAWETGQKSLVELALE